MSRPRSQAAIAFAIIVPVAFVCVLFVAVMAAVAGQGGAPEPATQPAAPTVEQRVDMFAQTLLAAGIPLRGSALDVAVAACTGPTDRTAEDELVINGYDPSETGRILAAAQQTNVCAP